MDANSKVQRYLDDLRRDAGGADPRRTIRGPGQASKDPLQFVATKTGENMAERAKQIVTATEQQKQLRRQELKGEVVVTPALPAEDDWQADLDTWRRKRKTKVESVVETTPPTYGSSVDYGVRQKDSTKEDILTIRSPEENNDSGIENRTLSHSPSTSLDFSPRSQLLSAELTSPKSLEAISPPTYTPPPPPPPLDQVLIPLSAPVSAHRTQAEVEPEDYPLPPAHLRQSRSSSSEVLSPSRARVSASFPAAGRHHQRLEPFVAQSLKEPQHNGATEKTVTADLTVELNREQKAHVQATKFQPKPNGENRPLGAKGAEAAVLRSSYTPRSLEEKQGNNHSYVSTARYSFEPTPAPASRSASTPNVSAQTKPIYRAVDIPFDDSATSYQPPKRDKDGLMTIVVEMGGQPVHKGFGFSVATERRRCIVDSVIVGTPADRQGLLIGDRIESINGESVADKYPSAINRLLHEAARNGEVILRVERTHAKTSFGSTPNLAAPIGNRFDQARSVFSEKQNDSYAEFKRKHSKAARERPQAREYNSLPRSSSAGYIGRTEYGDSDYRVSSLHDRTGPGKLTDFVPEVDRRRENGHGNVGARTSYEETRTIRNYELIGPTPPAVREEHAASSPLSQKTSDEDDDTVPGKAYLESRDWRDIINQQRQPAPGKGVDTRRIQQATSSLSNLPDIMDKKLEEQRRLVSERSDYQHSRSMDRREAREPREIYERSEYSFYEKTYTPTYGGSRNITTTTVQENERRFPSSDYAPREVPTQREPRVEPPKEVIRELPRDAPPSEVPRNPPPVPVAQEEPPRKEAITREPENRDPVVAVSGKHRCAHCGEELGRGAAMIVESLNLFYHLACFKCYVCKTPLGSGATGADVRVREGRLHCQSCYSSDRVQLSKV